MVWPDNVVTNPPSPTPVTPTGDLVPVGLIPLADCTGCSGEDLPPFHAKVCVTNAYVPNKKTCMFLVCDLATWATGCMRLVVVTLDEHPEQKWLGADLKGFLTLVESERQIT